MSRMYTIMLGLALCVGAAGVAAAQSSTPPTPPQASDSGMWGHGRRGHGGHGMQKQLFHGIKMTDAQQNQLKSIQQKYSDQSKSLRDSMRPAFDEARSARQRGDSAAARAAWDKTADTRTKLRALRDQQLSEIRAMLTPEQQQRFDQNKADLSKKMQQHRQPQGTA